MKQHWKKIVDKIDGMSLRERALLFATVAFMLVSLILTFFLDPLLAQQKKLSTQVVQQQEKMKDILAQIDTLLAAKRADAISPLRQRLEQIKRQITEGEIYLQSRRERLVAPEKMGSLMEQVLKRNNRLQLISLQTLPAAPLIEKAAKPGKERAVPVEAAIVPDKQVFRHGVKITVRGSYTDLLQYLTALEQLTAQMFWGEVDMGAAYPDVTLTLTLYTLSLDKTWLQI
jgi:MSHA biogenesis protein MshJ